MNIRQKLSALGRQMRRHPGSSQVAVDHSEPCTNEFPRSGPIGRILRPRCEKPSIKFLYLALLPAKHNITLHWKNSLLLPMLVPLIGFTGLGIGNAAIYLMRLTLFNPDISWIKKDNQEPWNNLGPNP